MNGSGCDGVALARSLAAWFSGRPDVSGVLLVGSYARGEAAADSDIDLVVLTENPESYRRDTQWHGRLPWGDREATVRTFRDAEYGPLWSRHVTFDLAAAGGASVEVEFGFAPIGWSDTDPPDRGTARVIRDGCIILFDREGALARLIASVSGAPEA